MNPSEVPITLPEEAEQAILNGTVDLDYQVINDKHRLVVVGVTNTGRFLTMIYTDRLNAVRIITAFDAEVDEQEEYWKVKGV